MTTSAMSARRYSFANTRTTGGSICSGQRSRRIVGVESTVHAKAMRPHRFKKILFEPWRNVHAND
jgi:hypothetical protein